MSTKYGLDDFYHSDPTLAFNFATYTFSSTAASLKDRYQADSSLKTDSQPFADELNDNFDSLDILDAPPFELFFTFYANKIHRKLRDMIAKKQINTIKDLHDNDFSNLCSFFVKEQFKFNPSENLKAPQGIIAWSKAKVMVNVIFMKYIEYILSNTKLFNIPSLRTPEENEVFVRENFVPTNISTGTDVSGYDKTQNATSLRAEQTFVYRRLHKFVDELYYAYFKHRATYVIINEFINQLIEYIKCSGEPGTLIMNTLWKILTTCYLFQISFSSPGLLLFQGDDDLINKPHCALQHRFDRLNQFVDFKLKIDTSYYPEFAGKFYTRVGTIRDLFRNAMRAYARSQNLTFKDRLDRPVCGKMTPFEKERLGINDRMTLRQAIRISYQDMLSDICENKIAILNEFYEHHTTIPGLGDLAFDTINYFVHDYATPGSL